MLMRQEREDIVSIRAVAIMMVAFGHSIILYSSQWNLYSTSVQAPLLDHVKNVINMLQMPLFFSVSGFCLVFTLLRGGGVEPLAFMRDKCRRILIPFLVIGFLWLLPIRLLLGYPQYRGKPASTIVLKYFLWGSDNGHLWFLPTLFLMLMLSLALVKILGTGARLDIASVVLALASVTVFIFARHLAARNLYLLQFCNYYCFFVLGFVFHRYEHSLRRWCRYPAGRYLALVVLLIGMALSWVPRRSAIAIAISLVAVLAVYLAMPNRSNPVLRVISRDSMGIYLFHSPMLYISFTYWPNINPWLMVLINFVGFGTVAVLLTELMRRIRCGFVIGE